MGLDLTRALRVPAGSEVTQGQYKEFLAEAYRLMSEVGRYFATGEDVNSLELAHLLPKVPETMVAIYVGINDAVCNKGLVTPFLVRHGHNNVFVFDPAVYAGRNDVPGGTMDAKEILNGFEPPNETWDSRWTYVMIEDPARGYESLWHERGYIDMVPAKFEDFTMLSDSGQSKVCTFIEPKAFDHPVNRGRGYLKAARDRGQKHAGEFVIPQGLDGETDGLAPVMLNRGEKLYVATTDGGPCAHCWSNIHADNDSWAVVNENSAVPLDLVIAKPAVDPKYGRRLKPAMGSADMTTDWFYRGSQAVREPLLVGLFKG